VLRDTDFLFAKKEIRRTATRLPKKAEAETATPDMIPNEAAMVTPSPAPALTPIMLGEASLFASTCCNIAPEHASAAPAKSDANTLGILEYTIILFIADGSFSKAAFISSVGEIKTLPSITPRKIASTQAKRP
jgi:hypothetical protein